MFYVLFNKAHHSKNIHTPSSHHQHFVFGCRFFSLRRDGMEGKVLELIFVQCFLWKFSILISASIDAVGRYVCRVATTICLTKHTLDFIEPSACLPHTISLHVATAQIRIRLPLARMFRYIMCCSYSILVNTTIRQATYVISTETDKRIL